MYRLVIFILIIYRIHSKSCSGHDGCKDQVFTDNSLTCDGGERCCKNVEMTCTSGMACNVKIKGGGHDQFQDSEIFAQEATSLYVSCAGGLRDCKNTKIFCPTTVGSTCTCTGCDSTTKMYCPYGVTCTKGGATLTDMNKYFCKGGGSNVYCNDITYGIGMVCPDNPPDVCVSTVDHGAHYSVTCVKGTAYERPRCPEYYQDRYDNIKYHQINVTVTEHEDAALPLEELCKASIPPKNKLVKSNNRAFQIKSWNVGCEKRKSKLNKCNSACNNPQGCCGTTCAGNSCSGGGCCAASKSICKQACDFMFSPQVYNVIDIDNVTNVTRIINKHINTTRWINTTRILNKTRWFNRTWWINSTRLFNKTLWFNKTRLINITKWFTVNKTRWINKTRLINITKWFTVNKTRWINKTRLINITKWITVNKTRWMNKTRLINETFWVKKNKTKWVYMYRVVYIPEYYVINKTIWRHGWPNKTKTKFLEKEIFITKTKFLEKEIFYMDMSFNEFVLSVFGFVSFNFSMILLAYIYREEIYENILDFCELNEE